MAENILHTDHLTKKFGRFTANDNISLSVERGAIYGLVGRNGAGKTTFMKMIASLSKPTSGSFTLCGCTYPTLGRARMKIGSLIEAPGIYAGMSAFDNLKARAKLSGTDDRKKIEGIIETVGLSKAGSKPAGSFSLGMKQRLGIGLALIGEPELLVLDEPINGLDPAGVAEVRETLLMLCRQRGMTIIISSHILGELSKLCTGYGFIEQGRLIREITGEQLTAECAEYVRLSVNDSLAAQRVLHGLGITEIDEKDGELHLGGCMDRTGEITEALVKGGVRVFEIARQGIDLESYYLELIGRE